MSNTAAKHLTFSFFFFLDICVSKFISENDKVLHLPREGNVLAFVLGD